MVPAGPVTGSLGSPGRSARLLRVALGYNRVLLDADVQLLPTTTQTCLRPAA